MKRSGSMLILWPVFTLVTDWLVVFVTGVFAYKLRFHDSFLKILPSPYNEIPPQDYYVVSSAVAATFIIGYMLFRNVYRQHWYNVLSYEIGHSAKYFLQAFSLLAAMLFFYRSFFYSRTVAILMFISANILLIVMRVLLFRIRKIIFSRRSPHKVIVIGENSKTVSENLQKNTQIGFTVVKTYEVSSNENLPDNLYQSVVDSEADTIIMAYRFDQFIKVKEIMKKLDKLHLDFLMSPDPTGMITSALRPFTVSGVLMIQLRGDPFSGWNGFIKRLTDIFIGGALFLLTLPIMIMVGLLVKLTSRGPVFYSQERVGLDGKYFKIYKFRSMKVGAESGSGPVWATKKDDRTTLIGGFLRRWSIDELPQFWNVLTGSMSLVGPRPERPFFVEQFKNEVPRYEYRHHAKCGLTGWAQVNGLRGQAPIEERTKYDIYYIENWSLGFDIRIILMTILAVITGRDAY